MAGFLPHHAPGHVASNGYWHPGRLDNCSKIPCDQPKNFGPVTIISADGVLYGHLTEDDVLVVDEVVPDEEPDEEEHYCGALTYRQTLETPAEYCENEVPCPDHPGYVDGERDGEDDDYGPDPDDARELAREREEDYREDHR